MSIRPERMTSQAKRLLPRVIVLDEMPPKLSAPLWSLKRFNVTNDAKALTQHRYLQSGLVWFGFLLTSI